MGGGDSQYRLELDAELGVEQMLRVMSCHVMSWTMKQDRSFTIQKMRYDSVNAHKQKEE